LTAKQEAPSSLSIDNSTNPEQRLEASDIQLKSTGKGPRPLQEGDWVEILDPHVAELFFDGKAKIVQLLKGIVDKQGSPAIEPKSSDSPREKARYAYQLSIGVREETRAVLFGATPDQTRRREYEKTVPTEKLKRIETPLEEPKIKKRLPEPKKVTTSRENGNGSKFHNPTEIKNDRPRRKRNADLE